MRKGIGAILLLGACLGLAACTREPVETTTAESSAIESSMAESETTTKAVEEPIRVAIVCKGTADENHAFDSGARMAAGELEAEFQAMYGEEEDVWEEQVLQACEDGYDYIVGAASEIADYIAKYGEEYPEIRFAVLDAEVPLENVTSVFISREEAYFQAGTEAARFTKQTETPGINEETVIGWIGGMNIPIVQDLFQAFANGARSVEPEIQILEQYTGSWENADEGQKIALSQFEQGADVILSLAGECGAGVLAAAEDCGFYVIGTDEMVGDSEAVVMTIESDMERIGYFVVRKLLQEELEGGTVVELSPQVLDKAYKAY